MVWDISSLLPTKHDETLFFCHRSLGACILVEIKIMSWMKLVTQDVALSENYSPARETSNIACMPPIFKTWVKRIIWFLELESLHVELSKRISKSATLTCISCPLLSKSNEKVPLVPRTWELASLPENTKHRHPHPYAPLFVLKERRSENVSGSKN